jgi:hypothetical protein
MSARQDIVKALVEKLKLIKPANGYQVDLWDNVITKHKFWDEVNDFPFVCVVAGQETREYLPGTMSWGFLGIAIKVYVKQEDPAEELEALLTDIESVIDDSFRLEYAPGKMTADIKITSIVTDEGLLVPYGIGEVNISVQYQVI